MSRRSQEDGLTRREFVYTAAAGIGGLAVGGVIGSQLGGDEQATVSTAGGDQEPIVIGGAFPLTGAIAGDGQDMMQGAQIGVDEVNERGGLFGRPLKLEYDDIESDLVADKISNVLNRLISEKNACAIVMGYTSYTFNEFEIPAQTGVPLMHINTHYGDADYVAQDIEKYRMVFMTDPTELHYGPGFAKLLSEYEEQGVWKPDNRKVAVVTASDAYSMAIAEGFRDTVEPLGWEISLFEKFNSPLAEWGPQLAKIRDNPPAVIFFSDYIVGDEVSFMQQFRNAPTPSLVYNQFAPSVPEYMDLAGDAAEGVIWSTMLACLPDKYGDAFIERYTDKFDMTPGISCGPALRDTVLLWAAAALRAGDPYAYDKVSAEIKNGLFRGVLGGYSFNPANNIIYAYPDELDDPSLAMTHAHFQIQDGKNVFVAPRPYITGEFKLPPWI